MSSMIVKPPGDEHADARAYEQIEAAVMETHRGRWFLSEYARRNRQSDTVMVLDAIEKLQRNVGARGGVALPYDRLQGDIMEMARAIANTEREIDQHRCRHLDCHRLLYIWLCARHGR